MIKITQPIIEKEEIKAVNEVLLSGILAQGPKTAELEVKFAKYCGTRYAIAFNSGTAAIHAGLYSLGVSKDDEVITTPFTFVATANPIIMQGAKVVFADISLEDFNINPDEIKKKITKKTKAIIAVDLYGQIYDADINKIAEKNNLKILEDACQAVGSQQNSKKAGAIGDVGAFSLYATKNIMSVEGGLLTTNNEEYAEKSKRFRHHGQSEQTRYEYWDLGYNYRTTDIAAAIALEQLKKVDKLNQIRIENARKLTEGLSQIKGLKLPTIKPGHKHVFHQYTIRITKEFGSSREELIEHLKKNGIGFGIYYPKPLHLHPHFSRLGYKEGDFPVAEKLAKEVISLPVHPKVIQKDIEYIIEIINNFQRGKK